MATPNPQSSVRPIPAAQVQAPAPAIAAAPTIKLPVPEKFTLRVKEVVWETPTVYLLRVNRIDGKSYPFIAGQWTLFRIDKADGTDIRRAYSIASPPFRQEYIEYCIKLVTDGEMTPILAHFKGGEEFLGAGPYGKFILNPELDSDLVVVATGTGIAPFRAMIEEIFYGQYRGKFHHDVYLFFGVRYENEIIYKSLWEKLDREFNNFHYFLTLSRPGPGWKGNKGYVQALVKQHLPRWDGQETYACGVPDMVDEMKAYFLGLGAPKAKVHYEKWF
jgi:ferredoxin-NADP reductase